MKLKKSNKIEEPYEPRLTQVIESCSKNIKRKMKQKDHLPSPSLKFTTKREIHSKETQSLSFLTHTNKI